MNPINSTPSTQMLMFDIGASNGCESRNFPGIVYAFEPCPKNLTQLFKIQKSNYHIIPKAVDILDRTNVPFYESNYTNSSSLLAFTEHIDKWKCPPKFNQKLKTIDQYNVETVRLDTFIIKQKLQNEIIDYVKIDTQGNDLNVIKSFGIFLKNVKKLQCEVQITNFPLYKSASIKNNLIDYMIQHGFILHEKHLWSLGQELELIFLNKKYMC